MEIHFVVIGEGDEGWRESVPVVPIPGDVVEHGGESYRVAYRRFVGGMMQVVIGRFVPDYDTEEIPY